VSTLDQTRLVAAPAVRAYLRRVENALADAATGEAGSAAVQAAATMAAGGKRLRPLLTYLSAPVERRETETIVLAGAAIELVHSATLVHDDVLDQAPLRRGQPTVWASSGAPVATAAGDLLFARAFALLCATRSVDSVAELATCTVGLARGESLQMQQARRPSTTPDEYLERVSLKTGLLFATACRIGGRLGGLDEACCALLHRYGRSLGIAFQLADDLLDCAGDPQETGKPLGTDLLDGTTTYPLLLAGARDGAVAGALRSRPAADAVLGLLDRVEKSGALTETRLLARHYAQRAEAALDDLDDHLDTQPLRLAALRVVERDH
jgi:geranylgeranyl pyrophosphate synthase